MAPRGPVFFLSKAALDLVARLVLAPQISHLYVDPSIQIDVVAEVFCVGEWLLGEPFGLVGVTHINKFTRVEGLKG